jgi:Spy/CpxP family protein refolding chaperone
MKRRILIGATVIACWTGSGQAQVPQPYAGTQAREIKALSEEQIADLKAGRGMGLAIAAEVNGFPGPRHALDLAGDLHLTADQIAHISRLFDSMKAEAVPLGEQLINQERSLDAQFANRHVTQQSLGAALADIGSTQAALRNAHLKYHLLTAELLTSEQIKRYAELRGYGQDGPASAHHGHGSRK